MEIHCVEELREAQEYAAKLGEESLGQCLEMMKCWEYNGCVLHLYKDSSPYSFAFWLKGPDEELVMNGGLLYHGSPDLSFAITFDLKKRWQIHT